VRKLYIPRPYAPQSVEFMLRHQRCNFWAPPGFGKTSMAYTAIDSLAVLDLEYRPKLVLAPLRVARDTWPDEALKWQHLKNMRVSAICGTPKQRLEALRRPAEVYTCNYENLPWLVEQEGSKWRFGTVVADEAVKLKGFRLRQGGKRAHALGQVAWTHVNRWLNLTGYPAPNGLIDLWGQMWFIDRGARLGNSFSAFTNRWFRTGYNGFGLFPLPHAQNEIQELIKDVTLTLDPKDWFDLKDPIVTEVKVKLPPAARKIYKEFEKTMFAELACGTELEVFNAAALTQKCSQIANGFAYINGGWKVIHDEKLDALESLVDEIGTQVLVAYSFVSDIERITARLGKRCALISKPGGMKAFKAGDAQVGLAFDGSLGHGVDGLQTFTNRLIRFGHTWNLDNRLQMLERIGPVRQFQAGLDRSVLIYDIVAEETVDESMIERHTTKADIQTILTKAMKRAK